MKLWFTLIAGPGSFDDLLELCEPIKKHFDGLCAVYHGERDDPEANYLEINKGEGRIIYLPYVGRHSHSRNAALWCGVIEQGDFVMTCDTLERPTVEFLRDKVPQLIQSTVFGGRLNCFLYYGKAYLFQYHESMRYQGTPHEALLRDDGGLCAVDISSFWPDESQIRVNMRPAKREATHWIGQYARYMLLPWGANHSLHGLQHQGDVNQLFPAREGKRLEFREEMRRRGFPRTEAGLKMMLSQPLDDKLKSLVNSDKVWVDWYRFNILGETDLTDEHAWITKRDIS